MKIRKNDNIVVIAGNDRGKTGKVLKVFPKTSRIIIEGINLRKRHTKPNQKNPQGGILEKEAPIHVSNVMILDPTNNEPTRIGSQIILDEKTGKKKIARVSKATGEMIQFVRFIISFSSCNKGYIHSHHSGYFINIYFRKDDLLFNTKRKITSAVK